MLFINLSTPPPPDWDKVIQALTKIGDQVLITQDEQLKLKSISDLIKTNTGEAVRVDVEKKFKEYYGCSGLSEWTSDIDKNQFRQLLDNPLQYIQFN